VGVEDLTGIGGYEELWVFLFARKDKFAYL